MSGGDVSDFTCTQPTVKLNAVGSRDAKNQINLILLKQINQSLTDSQIAHFSGLRIE